MHNRVITRGLTIAGVAIGSALLIGALAVAMRGLLPVTSSAAHPQGAQAPRGCAARRDRDRPAHRDTRPADSGNHHSGPAYERHKLRRLRAGRRIGVGR